MTKTFKRVLSFVLALALVAAFAPAGVISNADAVTLDWAGEGIVETYDFSKITKSTDGTWPIIGAGFGFDATKNPNWYEPAGLTVGNAVYASNPDRGGYWNGKPNFRTSDANNLFVITIVLPETEGMYTLSTEVQKYSNFATSATSIYGAQEFEMYLWPTSVTNLSANMTEEYKVGTVARTTAYEDTFAGNVTYDVGVIEVTEEMAGEEYYLAFHGSKAGTNSSAWMLSLGACIYNYKLDGTPVVKLNSASITADTTWLKSGTTTVTATGTLLDGSKATTATITYASSDDSIATVGETTGVVEQTGNGNVTITATVTLGDVTKKVSVDIYCGTEMAWAGADAIEIYDFTKVYSKGGAASVKIGSVTNYNMYGNTNWYEVPGQTVSYGPMDVIDANNYKYSTYNNARLSYYATDANSVFAPVIKLPSAGKYVVSMQYLSTGILTGESDVSGGVDINLYLWPKNATTTGNVVNMMTDEYLIGSSYRIYGTDSNVATPNLAVVSVTPEMAGQEYILGINATVPGGNSSWCGQYGFVIQNFTFTGVGSEVLKTVTLTGGETIAEVGDTAQLALTKKLSNGADATEATVAYSSDNTDFTVSDTGLVTANGYGKANITATVSLGTISRVEKVTVEVVPPVVEEDFEGNASSGYYAADAEAAAEEGIIAFNALFNKYATIEIDSYGFWVYEEGNEDAEIDNGKIEVKSLDGTLTDGWFHTTVTGIAVEDFDRVAVAVPFVVIDGHVFFGDAISSSTAANWLGEVPAAE